MKTLMIALFACSMGACAIEQSDQIDNDAVAVDEQSVINGAIDTGDPCVVEVQAALSLNATEVFTCTGTVIGPHTILTAAHCVKSPALGLNPLILIGTGTTPTMIAFLASSFTFDPLFNANNLRNGHDIGIVHTNGTLPMPVCGRGAVNANLPVRLVGYGANAHTGLGSGTKRQATTNIVDVNNILFQAGNSNSQICNGDSGGPAFQTINGQEVVVGVASFVTGNTVTSVCNGGGFHDRVDTLEAFINANTN